MCIIKWNALGNPVVMQHPLLGVPSCLNLALNNQPLDIKLASDEQQHKRVV